MDRRGGGRLILAVDLGKTGCRARRDGQVTEGRGAPGLATAGGVERALDAILAVAKGPVDAVAVGAAGALAAPEAAAALAARLCAALPADHAAVTSDAVTSHLGALDGHTGIVLALGTGAVAVAVDDSGRVRRADGWGPWLGDAGGGSWIGLRGLRAALAAEDGRGPSTALAAAASARFGPLAELPGQLEVDPARIAAGFAPDVLAAAEAGDAVAAAIRDRAADALAATVLALQPAPRLAITGGLARADGLLAPLRSRLAAHAPDLLEVPPRGHSLDGADRLARDRQTPHEPAVHRACRQESACD